MWKRWFAHTIRCAFMTTLSPNCKETLLHHWLFAECYARHDWSLLMICQSKDTRTTSQKYCILCFLQSDESNRLQDVYVTPYFYWIEQAEAGTKFALGDCKPSVDQLQQIELYFSVHFRKKIKMFSHRSEKMASKWGKNIYDTGRSPHFDVICCLLLNTRRSRWNLLLEWKSLGGATHLTR